MKVDALSDIVEVEKVKPVQQVIKSSVSFADALRKANEKNKEDEQKSRQMNWDYSAVSSIVAASGYIQAGYATIDRHTNKDDHKKD